MTIPRQQELLSIPIRDFTMNSVPTNDFVEVWATLVIWTEHTATYRINDGQRFAGRKVKIINGRIDNGPTCRCGHPEWYHENGPCDVDSCSCKRFDDGRRWTNYS